MEFGMINLFGFVIIGILLVPNIIYAIWFDDKKSSRNNKSGSKNSSKKMILIEQVGRYASMLLMVFPLGVWKFGFDNVFGAVVYLCGNGMLLVAYWVVWAFYIRKPSLQRACMLAVLPVIIFLISCLTLHHYLLVVAAVLFGIGHFYVTYQNHIE